MRKTFVVIAVVVLLVAGYFGSIALSLRHLVDAARSGNSAEVVARTDLERLRRSIAGQILDAYLDSNGRNKSALNRMLVNTYGASVADAMLAKFLTSENLTTLLQSGSVTDAQGATWQMPSLAHIEPSRLIELVGRLRPIQIKEMEIRTSETDTPETYTAINLHLDGTTWKLSGIRLPKPLIDRLARALPAR